jgi:hypothetical protein
MPVKPKDARAKQAAKPKKPIKNCPNVAKAKCKGSGCAR